MADDKKNNELSTEERVAAITAKVLGDTLNAKNRPFIKTMPTGNQCPECAQPGFIGNDGPFFACKGKHVKMAVLPAKYQSFFPGVCINGVWYKSSDYGQQVTIPADNEVQKFLENWDRQEEEYRNKRTYQPSQYNPVSRSR